MYPFEVGVDFVTVFLLPHSYYRPNRLALQWQYRYRRPHAYHGIADDNSGQTSRRDVLILSFLHVIAMAEMGGHPLPLNSRPF